jgi:hypothetical protein
MCRRSFFQKLKPRLGDDEHIAFARELCSADPHDDEVIRRRDTFFRLPADIQPFTRACSARIEPKRVIPADAKRRAGTQLREEIPCTASGFPLEFTLRPRFARTGGAGMTCFGGDDSFRPERAPIQSTPYASTETISRRSPKVPGPNTNAH